MPRLIQRGIGVAVLSNDDRAIAYFPDAGGDIGSAAYSDLDEARMRAEGLVAQTTNRVNVIGTGSPGSGNARLAGIYLRKGTVLTNGWVTVSANASGLTLAKLGLWRPSDGVLVAGTADLSSGLSAGSPPRLNQCALSAPYTIPADGLYYVGLLQVGTTPAVLMATASQSAAALPGAYIPYGALTSQTDLANYTPSGATPGQSSVVPWYGFS